MHLTSIPDFELAAAGSCEVAPGRKISVDAEKNYAWFPVTWASHSAFQDL